MELIDLSNNLFDQKLESNQKLIQDLQQMAKTVKISEEGKEGDISDEDLKSLLKSTIKKWGNNLIFIIITYSLIFCSLLLIHEFLHFVLILIIIKDSFH